MKNTKKDFLLPGEAVEACGFRPSDALCFHAGQDTLIVTPEDMTAMQAVNAIDALTELSTTLICALLNACELVAASSASFASGHSPKAHSLHCGSSSRQTRCAGLCRDCPAPDTASALSTVPDDVLEVLVNAGACLGSLDELLMENGVVFHG